MATMFYRELQRSEFENPDQLSQSVLDLAYEIRMALSLPMIILNDACSPSSTKHARYSLHKYGIDHELSLLHNEIVEKPEEQGKAIDFYFLRNGVSLKNHADSLLKILCLRSWGGLGIYPDWKPYPGFHIDTRTSSHSWYRKWWIGFKDADRKQKYIYNCGMVQLERMMDRGHNPNGANW